MSNLDKAAQMIRDLSEVDGETLGYAHVHNIAQDLADAGLLAPELPEPEEHGGKLTCPLAGMGGWTVSLRGSWVRISDERGAVFAVDAEVAHNLGLALLAATSAQDGHQ